MAFSTHKVAWVIVALCFMTISGFAFLISSADSTTFRVSAFGDTYVSTASPAASYGGASVIWVSKVGTAENWGMVSFNLASKLPASVVIVRARIKLLVNQSYGTFPAATVTGRLLADFSEATVTYNTVPPTAYDTYTSNLFDRRPMPGFTVFVDVTQQLMAWRSSYQRTYFGLTLNMTRTTANAGIAFASRENPSQEGPVLQVFTLAPGQYGYSISRGEILAVRPET